ncbi:FAD-dependent oxidoreductase [Calycomorphotria hydatis]|nr:FAD-dependent oxidoreductase [Calycomorphotria hydatis]
MEFDAVIFGGGAAGLWTLDRLSAGGCRALLLESHALGRGQTVASQGIIHGGLKYTLAGMLTKSAEAIRDMPGLWRECLEGERIPNLSTTKLRASCCYLWRTDSIAGRLGMIGAKMGLRIAPHTVPEEHRPPLLAHCTGPVARLDEQVIAPVSFLNTLRERNLSRLLKIDAEKGLHLECDATGGITRIDLRNSDTGEELVLRPRHVILAAGRGNEQLLRMTGHESPQVQRRPLHMVMLRGDLPEFQGHCVDGSRTRVTITSERLGPGQVVWQVGGQIAEDGVDQSEAELLSRTKAELQEVLPTLDLSNVEWSTYRVDRAEGKTTNGKRPESVQIQQHGNVIVAFPTKLALAPVMAREVAALVSHTGEATNANEVFSNWPRPEIAAPPWETATWMKLTDRAAA